ncbi:MAG: 4Fe-4S binding protein [Desulfobulbus sp.]|nr:4Fe-4S binding protein [Desulfobulbus sp.]
MGHSVGKDIYRQLAERLDQAPMRTPWTAVFQELITALYSPEEAALIIQLPYRPAALERIGQLTGIGLTELQRQLESLCGKGLVIDIWDGSAYRYMVSPLVIGFFEFTMMRVGQDLPMRRWAELFQGYMFGGREFLEANFGGGQQVSVMRALPHEETVNEQVEILDYERAAGLIENHSVFSLGLCSCRHEKHHLGHPPCRVPMETCTSMGAGAQFLIRNGLARAIDKQQMRDILARSRDLGLTLSADNVRQDAGFICHCCGCCCNLLLGIRETGYTGILVTASVVAEVNQAQCIGCGLCVHACPIDAIQLVSDFRVGESTRIKPKAKVNDFCLGCGVCALKCPTRALQLHKRTERVYHPEDSFERVLMQSLERGTLQTLLFDNPKSRSHQFMRGLVGGFLKLPLVKQTLMSETVRSRFLSALRKAAEVQPKEIP